MFDPPKLKISPIFFLLEIINIIKGRIKKNQHQQGIGPPYMYEQNTRGLHKKLVQIN